MRELHPASRFFPPLAPDEYESLKASVAANGVLVPVKVDAEDRIVDGRHRAQAADEVGVDCPAEPLPDGMDAWTYARTANLDRRHLTAQQRAAVLKLAELRGEAPEVAAIREQAKEREQSGASADPKDSGPQGQARDQVGALVGASGKTVDRVERALEVAKKVGHDPIKVAERIASGATTAQAYVKESTASPKAAPETPVWDAWWRAVQTVMNKVDFKDFREVWSDEQCDKVDEWTDVTIARLNAVRSGVRSMRKGK